MIDVLVCVRAEDAVLEFLTVLSREPRDEAVVVLADPDLTVTLPARAGTAERLALLAPHLRPPVQPPSSGPRHLAERVRAATAGREATVWTHSPADNREARARLGRDTVRAAHGLPVRHAVGHSPYLQVVSDEDVPLTPELAEAKREFVNHHGQSLLASGSPQYRVDTARVPASERFFRSDPAEAVRLYALLASLGEDAAEVDDPWEFAASPYERARLDATLAWTGRHCTPGTEPLIEVGACEGALTRRLLAAGHRVHATEPNDRFRRRLTAALAAAEHVRVSAAGLKELADGAGPHGPHLLIEMLYYGQEPALIDRLPADLVLLALEPEALRATVRPWLAVSPHWEVTDETVLVPPRLEAVCGGRAYLTKRGSHGLALRRTSPPTAGHAPR
ncbi:hypothetical protein ACIPPN_24835 [Streptomyces diastaticus]|uniref:hypothetical protein n=1 Tax=Streptomyces diastaticus TaxID=1956 RepID=UPI00365A4278